VSEIRDNLVRNVKRRRGQLGISQMELASRAELSSGYIGEIEMGRKFPTPEVLERLAAALETKPFTLIMGEDDVAESAAFYVAVDAIRERLNREMDHLSPKKP
jgi:transcriptional regulator with XRE-family HTH domain